MDFSLNLSAPSTKLMDFLTDYENMPRFIPVQLKSVKIIEKKDPPVGRLWQLKKMKNQ